MSKARLLQEKPQSRLAFSSVLRFFKQSGQAKPVRENLDYFTDHKGIVHPIRSTPGYEPALVGESDPRFDPDVIRALARASARMRRRKIPPKHRWNPEQDL